MGIEKCDESISFSWFTHDFFSLAFVSGRFGPVSGKQIDCSTLGIDPVGNSEKSVKRVTKVLSNFEDFKMSNL